MSHQEDGPDDTDKWLYENFMLPMRIECMKSLLSGNDTQCFSTEQYKQRFIERENIDFPRGVRLRAKMFTIDIARKHCEELRDRGFIREVSPDIWTTGESSYG